MADELDTDAMLQRFRDRAHAVKTRPCRRWPARSAPSSSSRRRTTTRTSPSSAMPRPPSRTASSTLRVDLRPPTRRRRLTIGSPATGSTRRSPAIDAGQRRRPERARRRRRRAAQGAGPRRADDGLGAAARSRRRRGPAAGRPGPPPPALGARPAATTPTAGPATCAGARRSRPATPRRSGPSCRRRATAPTTSTGCSRSSARSTSGTDPAVQTHEDALCLTFLQTQFAELADKLGDDRTVEVVRKTLAKMSDQGRTEALALALSPWRSRWWNGPWPRADRLIPGRWRPMRRGAVKHRPRPLTAAWLRVEEDAWRVRPVVPRTRTPRSSA